MANVNKDFATEHSPHPGDSRRAALRQALDECTLAELADVFKAKVHRDKVAPYVLQADIMRQVMAQQLELQRESFGIDPRALAGKDRADYVTAMALALHVEVDEALLEISWKPWATGQWFNREAYLEELIDVLHFWMNLVLIATDDPLDLLGAYMAKHDINKERQAAGYTGEKCKECGRDI